MGRELKVLTVGHSNHSLKGFVELLKEHSVTAVGDVRSAPYSRFVPHFNQRALQRELARHSIQYVFLGRELGARSKDPSCYVDGRVDYSKLARTGLFISGIERVRRGAEMYRLALMCAEADPIECHRTLLVARSLVAEGFVVEHILPNGELEPYDETLGRLLDVVGLPRSDLFRSRNDLIQEGLARQEKRIAYVDTSMIEAERGGIT